MIARVSEAVAGLPSVRDFEIFKFVKCACGSTRAAAREFHLSQTRIRQVVSGVQASFLAAVPPKCGDEPPDTRLVVAEQWAREQLEYLYGRAVQAFTESETADVHGNVVPGKPTFLLAAARVALWMAKVPVHALPAFREIEDADDEAIPDDERRIDTQDPEFAQLREMLARFERRQLASGATRGAASAADKVSARAEENSPPEDCSPGAVSSESAAAGEMDATDASSDVQSGCGTSEPESDERRASSLLTAQAAVAQHETVAPTKGTLGQANHSPLRPPLNRKERRARERLRQKLLAGR